MIAAMLSSASSAERDRLRQLRVPRSTYHAARRRAYLEGWLRDRYIPHPARFGWKTVRFLLARPYAEQAGEMLRSWSEETGCVVVWGGSQAALGVFFHHDREESETAARATAARAQNAWGVTLHADSTVESMPVYFDFEGSWAHLSEAAGALAYPHGLGGPTADAAGGDPAESPTSDPRRAWAAAELLHRPFASLPKPDSPHRVGPLGLPWSQRRLLTSGWVSHRVLLDPARVPPFSGRSPDQVVWITGHLRGESEPSELFAKLTRDCRVYPFLFVVHDGVALLGALGWGPGPGEAGGSGGPRRPVMATLKIYLEGIELIQEASGQMGSIVDHRYDRLLERRLP